MMEKCQWKLTDSPLKDASALDNFPGICSCPHSSHGPTAPAAKTCVPPAQPCARSATMRVR